MKSRLYAIAMSAILGQLLLLPGGTIAAESKGLPVFANDAELQAYIDSLTEEDKRQRRQSMPKIEAMAPSPSPGAPTVLLAPGAMSLDSVAVTGALAQPESITNNQTTGVDEGDIVKRSGDFLIVLRRGRLFTIRIGEDRLTPVSAIDAYAPDVNPGGTWYDEMLVADGRVVVIGYSYERGGTEIGVFDLAQDGNLRYRDTYQLRGSDYYSASNYASRLVGSKLIFYTPITISFYRKQDITHVLPALRHWRAGTTPADFKRILPANRIYRSPSTSDVSDGLTLHSVSECDLASAEMTCRSTAVLGPSGRVFYVSQDSVYVWTAPFSFDRNQPNASFVARIPFDGTAPVGLRASGSPIDQMSFLQRDDWLNVVVGSENDGEGMWSSRSKAGELALLRVPLTAFGNGNRIALSSEYRALPAADAENDDVHNRFVGDWLLYGASPWGWGTQAHDSPTNVHAIRYATDKHAVTIPLRHEIERIDALGHNAVVIGNADNDLMFTTLKLDARATPVSRYVQPNAGQGDDRTHGFFYKPQTDDDGLLGLPVIGQSGKSGQLSSASVLFLRNQSLHLSRAGDLRSSARKQRDDACKASCVDWYGNARPIFIGERVFALLGYELVEGALQDGRIRERRRVDFAPR